MKAALFLLNWSLGCDLEAKFVRALLEAKRIRSGQNLSKVTNTSLSTFRPERTEELANTDAEVQYRLL